MRSNLDPLRRYNTDSACGEEEETAGVQHSRHKAGQGKYQHLHAEILQEQPPEGTGEDIIEHFMDIITETPPEYANQVLAGRTRTPNWTSPKSKEMNQQNSGAKFYGPMRQR
ncbi:hypothetical protein CHARACLAT_017075 [Characodon lateralis]|uniref:Uncharacterized protein n=1 Tax=Characodon lateralis TaxID=208331 RepID=A0ABU7EUB1_9TELE|nr:hypothetical protein [Characodon lateralis]